MGRITQKNPKKRVPYRDDLLSRFREHLLTEDRSPGTIRNYLLDIRRLVHWFSENNGEEFRLEALTPIDISSYRSFLQTVKNLKLASINRNLQAIRKLAHFAREKGLIEEDPTHRIKRVEEPPLLAPRSLDRVEINRLLRQIQKKRSWQGRRDFALVQLMLQTGERVSEVAALRISDLTVSERKGQVVVRSGKGNTYRAVPLNVSARQAISDYLAARPHLPDVEHLFISQEGESLTVRSIQHMVFPYAQKARLEDISCHSLRHTFGTFLQKETGDLPLVVQLMGHKSIQTTTRYARRRQEDLDEAVEKSSLSDF